PERSNPSILCRRVLGSSPAPLSQRLLLNPSPNGRGKIQSTPQDRIPTSKTSSHQSHSQMGVPMHGCSSPCRTAAHGADGVPRTPRYDRGIPYGSSRSTVLRMRFARVNAETSGGLEYRSIEHAADKYLSVCTIAIPD